MNDMELRIFQSEVKKQCEFALTSIAYINDSLSNLEKDNAGNQLWLFVQNFLVSTANVSKLLWGSKKQVSESRKPLRDSLGVEENSLIKSRELRNHFEHFDERIESWATSSKRKNFVDSNIGPSNFIVGVDLEDFLRNFDTDAMAVTFKGDTFELQPIVDELVDLRKKAELNSNQY